MTAATLVRSAVTKKKRRRRFRFSLNGLAIQLAAFALSFTLVALLVVSGSQAAFVEPSEVLENYVPIGTAAPTEGSPRRPSGPGPVVDTPPPSESAAPTTEAPDTEAQPSTEPVAQPSTPDAEVELTDDAAGTALFANERLIPGLAVERCIAVTFAGTADVESVRLYAAATSGDLAPYLDLTITMGEPATAASSSCTGFGPAGILYSGTLAGFATTHPSYGAGLTAWDPSEAEETRGFRFSLTVRDEAAAAGKSATFGFSWRAEAS